jgi:hypothetical protein
MKKQQIYQETGELIDSDVMKSITIDCAIFGFENGSLEVLLIKHSQGISKVKWGLPGGWILIGFNLLPEKFTLLQLMQLYEEILNIEMDKPNFRRKILKMKLLKDMDEKQTDVSHRAAKLYRFDHEIYKKLTKKGLNFEF